MPGYTVTVTQQDVRRGDSWRGIPGIGPFVIDGDPPEYAADSARMYFRRRRDSNKLGYGLTTETPTPAGFGIITILDAANWQFQIPKQILLLDAGDWYWDLEITDTNGDVLTPYHGVLTIEQDVSRT